MQATKTYTEGTLTRVPLRCIVDSPDITHRPLSREWVGELAKDIIRNGLDTPLLVWNGGGGKGKQVELDGGKVVPATFLVGGLHRRAALREILKSDAARYKELFPDGVPVIVRGGELKDALTASLRENVQRKDVPAEQVLPIVLRLRDEFGMKLKEIGRSVGRSESWVSQVLSIEEELGEEGMEEVEKGGLKFSQAREAARKIKESKKSGKPLKASEVVKKEREKTAKRKAAGKQRAERKVSATALWKRYLALPRMSLGEKVDTLENTLGYLAGDEDYDLPEDLATEAEESEKATKKEKKSAKDDEDDSGK